MTLTKEETAIIQSYELRTQNLETAIRDIKLQLPDENKVINVIYIIRHIHTVVKSIKEIIKIIKNYNDARATSKEYISPYKSETLIGW